MTVALIAVGAAMSASAGSEPCTAAATCRDSLALRAGGLVFYYRSQPLAASKQIQRAVIVVHGNKRNANEYFEDAIAAARLEESLDETLLVAPNFRTREDHPARGEHYWSSHGWKIGNKSADAGRISSFSVMDELVAKVCGAGDVAFPALRTVIIVGHSAGGQFVNRYAAGGAACPDPAIEVRFIAMNPSSYLYVDGRRRSGANGAFRVPETTCAGYDDYKYGLRDLNAYMQGVGNDELRRRLFKRRTWYLAGSEDTGTRGALDRRCQAILQGENRLARHANYRDYARLFDDWTGATFVLAPGIGHSGERMLSSEIARSLMFH